jgi:hypothetical protein
MQQRLVRSPQLLTKKTYIFLTKKDGRNLVATVKYNCLFFVGGGGCLPQYHGMSIFFGGGGG